MPCFHVTSVLCPGVALQLASLGAWASPDPRPPLPVALLVVYRCDKEIDSYFLPRVGGPQWCYPVARNSTRQEEEGHPRPPSATQDSPMATPCISTLIKSPYCIFPGLHKFVYYTTFCILKDSHPPIHQLICITPAWMMGTTPPPEVRKTANNSDITHGQKAAVQHRAQHRVRQPTTMT